MWTAAACRRFFGAGLPASLSDSGDVLPAEAVWCPQRHSWKGPVLGRRASPPAKSGGKPPQSTCFSKQACLRVRARGLA